MMKHRKIKNPELHAINRPGSEQFYLLSADVGKELLTLNFVNCWDNRKSSKLQSVYSSIQINAAKAEKIRMTELWYIPTV